MHCWVHQDKDWATLGNLELASFVLRTQVRANLKLCNRMYFRVALEDLRLQIIFRKRKDQSSTLEVHSLNKMVSKMVSHPIYPNNCHKAHTLWGNMVLQSLFEWWRIPSLCKRLYIKLPIPILALIRVVYFETQTLPGTLYNPPRDSYTFKSSKFSSLQKLEPLNKEVLGNHK